MSRLRLLVNAVLMLLLFGTSVSAASIALAWDPNVEPEVNGYLVQVGSVPGGTEQTFNVGAQTSWTFTSATAGKTYYFRVQAYTPAGVKSLPSNEVSGKAPLATTVPPFGAFDTPTNNSTGITGSVAVTGWALDDNGVSKVRILRGPITGENPDVLVPIGDATLVAGARPDIAAKYPTYPGRDYAGWGYLMLTNFLPNLGNGTFTIYAYADDGDGHSTPLGTKTITVNNYTATTPFGAIDTPSQGQTVAGVINNFGWVLSPGTRRADPTGGGTVQVVIDGVKVGSPAGWTSRSDLSGYFPLAQYKGINTALGVFTFDTRTLTNGVHTIAWAVTDNTGGTAGVGSRYFTVANGAA
ncbi:MAG: fibronectin type III domain-containing protein, partial [Acidobacteriota bacterium]